MIVRIWLPVEVGDDVGAVVGFCDGATVGICVGTFVGLNVGGFVGNLVMLFLVGTLVGTEDGWLEGCPKDIVRLICKRVKI